MIRFSGLRLVIGLGALGALFAVAMVGGASILTHAPMGATFATAHRAAAPSAPAVAEPRTVTADPAQPMTAAPVTVNTAPSAPAASAPAASAPFASTTVPASTAPAAQEVPTAADRCTFMTGGGHGRPVPPMCAPLAPQP
jgi:hypothetical protein